MCILRHTKNPTELLEQGSSGGSLSSLAELLEVETIYHHPSTFMHDTCNQPSVDRFQYHTRCMHSESNPHWGWWVWLAR